MSDRVAVQPDRPTILVVDDEPDIVFAVKFFLEAADYNVLTASNGVQALTRLSDEPMPNLVVLDLMMPKVDGWNVLRLMRSNDEWREIPVVLLTALQGDQDQARGWITGADWYQKKPFDPSDLVTVISRLMQGDDSQLQQPEGLRPP